MTTVPPTNNPLFDQPETPGLTGSTAASETPVTPAPTLAGKVDKIFHNDYNSGNIEFEEFHGVPKVDVFYAEANLKDTYDSFDYQRNVQIMEDIDDYFRETEQGKLLVNKKKIPKQMLSKIYVTLRSKFEGGEYTGVEIFTNIADYFNLNYEVLYENIPAIYREELVKELDEKFQVLSRRGIKKLF